MVLQKGKKQRSCATCGKIQNKTIPKPEPTWTLLAKKISLIRGKATKKQMISDLAAGDYVKSWKSAKTSIVTVNGNKKGKVTLRANKKGNSTITATLASGIKIKFSVTVK